MKHLVVALLIVAGSVSRAVAQQPVPVLPLEPVSEPLKFPADIHLGEAAGVALNSKHHIFVFSRGNVNGPSYMAAAAQQIRQYAIIWCGLEITLH